MFIDKNNSVKKLTALHDYAQGGYGGALSAWYSDSVSEGSESVPRTFTDVQLSPSHLVVVKMKQETPGNFTGRC